MRYLLFLFGIIVSSSALAIELKPFVGLWKVESCDQNNRLASDLEISFIDKGAGIEIQYLGDYRPEHKTLGFTSRPNERYWKTHNLNQTSVLSTTESVVIQDRVVIAAIHQVSDAFNPDLKYIESSLKQLWIEGDGRLVLNTRESVLLNDLRSGFREEECKFVKKH